MQIAGAPGDTAGAGDLLPYQTTSTQGGWERRLMRPWSALSLPRGSRAAIQGAAFMAHRWGLNIQDVVFFRKAGSPGSGLDPGARGGGEQSAISQRTSVA